MYDEKKEQLKEILNKNLTKENIEEKLKQEKLKQDAIKKQKEHKQKKIFYILATIFTLIVISIITYVLVYNNIKKQNIEITTNDNLTKKKEQPNVNKKQIEIKSEDIKKISEKKETQDKLIKKQIEIQNKEKNEQKSNENEINEKKLYSKKQLKTIFNTKKFTLVKCYGYDVFQKKPPYSCNNKIKAFIERNSNAIRFEVIGIVGESDIKKAKKMSENKDIQNYIINGVSRNRVVEAFWVIKNFTGDKKIILTPVNYTITSKNDNRGIILRAYQN